MAKLHSYYGLCPIIDQHSLLGISEDYEAGHAIVTIGKNICIKYKISDQKQVQSWRTKDKYSSLVIYDVKNDKYVAAFNQSYLRMWDKEEEEQVDKQKKIKFNVPIYTIFSYLQQSFIIFTNGLIYELNTAMEQRKNIKSDGIISSNGYISDVLYTHVDNNIYIGLMIVENVSKLFYWKKIDDNYESEYYKFELTYSNFDLVGYMFNKPTNAEEVALVTLWSNGKLFSYPLHGNTNPPGNQYAIIESLSSEFFVTMLALDQDYIAMYGADKNGEGATLIIYNIQFKVVQSKQTFKMFTNSAKIWQIENNLLMCVGQNLAVVPFQLDAEQLAALVGSHKALCTEKDPDITIMQELHIENWDEKLNVSKRNAPVALEMKISELSKQGHAESTICEILVPELIENQNVKSIKSCIKYFCDIPENCIAKILKFILTTEDKHFKTLKQEKNIIIKPYERRAVLNLILSSSFNDLYLMPYLRKELDISDVVMLFKYIIFMLSDEDETLVISHEKKLIEWSCLLLDANYQKFLLTKDNKVIEILKEFESFIREYLVQLEQINERIPVIKAKCKPSDKLKQISCNSYSVEEIKLF